MGMLIINSIYSCNYNYYYYKYYLFIYYSLAPSQPGENISNGNGSLSSHSSLDSSANSLSHDYDRIMSLKPTRPAPKLPPSYSSSNYSTLNSYQGKIKFCFNVIYLFFNSKFYISALEGIPFILNQNIVLENKSILQVIYNL